MRSSVYSYLLSVLVAIAVLVVMPLASPVHGPTSIDTANAAPIAVPFAAPLAAMKHGAAAQITPSAIALHAMLQPLVQVAQQRNLFDLLFGKRKKAKRKVIRKKKRRKVRKKKRRLKKRVVKKRRKSSVKKVRSSRRKVPVIGRRAPKRQTTARTVGAGAAGGSSVVAILGQQDPEIVEKALDAKKVLVIGDFFSGGLAEGLEKQFEQNANVVVVNRQNGSSGLVRDDFYNWPEQVGLLIDEVQPALVVVQVGSNDRQPIRSEGVRHKKRTEEWDKLYKERAKMLADAVRAKKLPLVWVGLPPVRFKSMNGDFLFFNDLYRVQAERVGGQFVDIWDGFTDAEGNYVKAGPDVNGQIVRLRGNDGINMSRGGKNKMAFYAERGIKKFLGNSAVPGFGFAALAPVDVKPLTPTYDPERTGKTVVISLDDPSADGGLKLDGAVPMSKDKAAIKFPDESRVAPQRVDSALWPPRSAGNDNNAITSTASAPNSAPATKVEN